MGLLGRKTLPGKPRWLRSRERSSTLLPVPWAHWG